MANRAKKRFYLIKRRNRRSEGKAIYYCRIRGSDGHLQPWKSTGQTTKSAAENWALDHLDEIASVRETLTFKEYARGWWMPDHQYLARKLARGTPVAPSYADVARSYLSRHIAPHFGSQRLDKITPQFIESWEMNLKERISPATANRCLAVLRTMLREAKRQGLINDNPAARVEQLKETPRERGILALDEARDLLNENKFADYWKSEIAFAANLLAATSGMRLGEVVAIRVQDIRDVFVVVEHSWDRKNGGPMKE